jgi:hypothetical protein
MSYWRKLLIVVLLALSLPVQSFAAISMKCVPAHANAGEAPAQHVMHDMAEHDPGIHGMAVADDGQPHASRNADHAHLCSTCASCCVGAALPAVAVVATAMAATRIITRVPPSDAAVSFLTDGIERPPRTALV